MKKRLIAVAIAGAALSLAATPALADQGGNPNANACVGQTTSYVVQGNDITPFNSANGLGNVAKANGVPTKEAAGFIKFLCSL